MDGTDNMKLGTPKHLQGTLDLFKSSIVSLTTRLPGTAGAAGAACSCTWRAWDRTRARLFHRTLADAVIDVFVLLLMFPVVEEERLAILMTSRRLKGLSLHSIIDPACSSQ